MSKRLRGVFAAVATASTADREVDCAKSIALGHYLLNNGCDGLNVICPMPARWQLSRRISTCFRLPRPFCLKHVTEHSRAATAKWKRLMPPFAPFPDVDNKAAVTAYDKVRAT